MFDKRTYGYKSGTSMAAPHVSGLVALLRSYAPAMTAAEIRTRILGTGVTTPALMGRTGTGGRINAIRALTCSDGRADCDGNPDTGCETVVTTPGVCPTP